jgi:hypothetical protein
MENSNIMVRIQAEIETENLPYISHTVCNWNRSLRSESVKKVQKHASEDLSVFS